MAKKQASRKAKRPTAKAVPRPRTTAQTSDFPAAKRKANAANGKAVPTQPMPFDKTQKSLHMTRLDVPSLLSGPFWGELRVFLAVAKAKSFSAAAKALNMSQPTVSRQVRRLQDLIGSQLVVSSKNSLRLTKKGQELAELLIPLDEKLFEISRELRVENREAEGEVRVSVTEALAGLFIAPALQAFSEQYPRIRLHIRNPINLTQFRENQTDVMVGYAPEKGGIESRALGFVHLIPQATREYIDRYGMPTRSNLESHLFLDTDYYSAETGIWDEWHDAVKRGVVSHRCDNSFAYGLLAKSGLGVALLGSYTLADSDAVPLDLDVHIRLPLYILAMSDRLQAKPVRVVYDWLSEIFAPTQSWFAPEMNLRNIPTEQFRGTIGEVTKIPPKGPRRRS